MDTVNGGQIQRNRNRAKQYRSPALSCKLSSTVLLYCLHSIKPKLFLLWLEPPQILFRITNADLCIPPILLWKSTASW